MGVCYLVRLFKKLNGSADGAKIVRCFFKGKKRQWKKGKK